MRTAVKNGIQPRQHICSIPLRFAFCAIAKRNLSGNKFQQFQITGIKHIGIVIGFHTNDPRNSVADPQAVRTRSSFGVTPYR